MPPIVAIGAQNASVLRQGLRGEHVGAVVAARTPADRAPIAAGIARLGALVGGHPGALAVARYTPRRSSRPPGGPSDEFLATC